jgi:hypothetical protein
MGCSLARTATKSLPASRLARLRRTGRAGFSPSSRDTCLADPPPTASGLRSRRASSNGRAARRSPMYYVGTDDARVLRVSANGNVELLHSFEAVVGRDTWYAARPSSTASASDGVPHLITKYELPPGRAINPAAPHSSGPAAYRVAVITINAVGFGNPGSRPRKPREGARTRLPQENGDLAKGVGERASPQAVLHVLRSDCWRATEREERFVDVGAPVVADAEAPELVEPGKGALHDPPPTGPSHCHARCAAWPARHDVTSWRPRRSPPRVAAIPEHTAPPLAWSSPFAV